MTISNFGKDVEQLKLSYTADGSVKEKDHFGEEFGYFLYSLYIHIPSD